MQTTTPFDLRAAVAEAAAARDAAYEAETRRIAERDAAEAADKAVRDIRFLNSVLAKVGIPPTATAPTITIDDLTFHAGHHYQQDVLYLLERCPTGCGGTVERGPIYQLADVAPLLDSAPRDVCKACEQAAWEWDHDEALTQERAASAEVAAERSAAALSLEARLLAVLREFIAAGPSGGEEN